MSSKRTDADYEIEALSKGLIVLEALKGMHWEPVTIKTVMERTRYPRDIVDRSLKTLRLRGYAIYENGKWRAGRRLVSVAASLARQEL